jgi:serine/threonine-protein kinase
LNSDLTVADENEQTLPNLKTPFQLAAQSRFESEELLGAGAYGEVWRVRDHLVERSVAVKKLISTDERIFSEMQREASLGARVAHCGTPTVHDIGIDEDGRFRVIMEYLEGESLDKVIERLRAGDKKTHEEFPFAVRADILMQILRVLVSAHSKNIVHCDIKPANILIGSSKETYLCDWGISVDLREEKRSRILGTPSYMAPEQIHLDSFDERVDVFGLAALAYTFFSLTPWHPYTADIQSYLNAKLTHQPKDIDLLSNPFQGHVPSEYRAWIHKGLRLDPNDRHQSAVEMLMDLNQIQQGVFCASCPRTYIKHWGFRYFRALDNAPWRVMILTILLMSFMATLFTLLGIYVF